MAHQVILDPAFRRLAVVFTPEDLDRLYAIADVVWARDEPMPPEEVARHRGDAIALITGHWARARYGEVGEWPQLRAILEVGGGFPPPRELDYPTCFARGVRVLSCAPAFGPAVAEMGLALALAAARQIAETDRAFRTGEPNWSHEEFGGTFTLYDKPVGFIGFGGLARSLQPLLEPFRCRIKAFDPWLTETYLRTQGVEPVGLEELLPTCRIIWVLAVPTASNQALLDRERLSLIREDAVLVLLSRSHLVDFDVLTELVLARRFRAAIDVFPEEPLPRDHPIRQAPLAVLSSHRAGAQGEALHHVGRIVVNDLEAILRGLTPQQMQVAQPEYIRDRA